MTNKTHSPASAVQTNAAAGERIEIAITVALADSPVIDLRGSRGMIVRCPAGTVTNLSIALADKEDGTYTILQDEDGTDVALTLSGSKWKTVAKEIFYAHFAKIYGAAADLQILPKS
jgi:hypothetical protein